MASEQDWCLQCGAGAAGSLQRHSGQWRAGAAVLSALALLIAGAAAAAYAALSKSSPKRHPPVVALARTPALASPPPAAATPPPAASVTPTPTAPKLLTPTTVKPAVPLVKPATIPLTGAAAKPPAASTTPVAPGTTNTGASKPSTGGATSTPEKQPTALTLDTNAASTYNPYSYVASNFGDPSLAIDGETSTAWTARLEPSVAPKMAEGLLIDLKTPQRLSALALTTTTPSMTIQIYGAIGNAAPASITDPAWTRLSALLVAKKRVTRIALANPKHAFRFLTLWISKAPASAIGTPQASAHVSVNELELFPAR
jgi:hypothetical protein